MPCPKNPKKEKLKAYPSRFVYDKYGNHYEVIWKKSKQKTLDGNNYIFFVSYRNNPETLKGMKKNE